MVQCTTTHTRSTIFVDNSSPKTSVYFKMSDPGFDPCECMWNHELAMRRLISLLRSSQSYCTDNECISDFPGSTSPNPNQSNLPFFIFCWVVLAMALFFLRPRSLRHSDNKQNENQGQGPQPPNPPPAIN